MFKIEFAIEIVHLFEILGYFQKRTKELQFLPPQQIITLKLGVLRLRKK